MPPAPGGRTRALNAGLAAARGGWVAYLDDDDLYLPDHLATLDAARAAGARAAHTSVRKVRQAAGPDGKFRDAEELTVYDRACDPVRLLSRNDVPLIGLGHERALADAAGRFDETFDLFEDWDFLIRLSRVARVVHVPKVTAVYRVREGSSVTTIVAWGSPEAQRARARVYAKHAALMTPEAEVAILDELEEETHAVIRRENDLRGEYGRVSAHAAGLEKHAAALEVRLHEAEGRARSADERAARLEADLAATRDEAHRSATREGALAVQNTALAAEVARRDATLDQIYRSRVWRLFSPWWKLKERLKR